MAQESREVKSRPKAIAGSPEVVANRRRIEAGIDSNEKNVKPWTDYILDGLVPGGF